MAELSIKIVLKLGKKKNCNQRRKFRMNLISVVLIFKAIADMLNHNILI